MIREKAANPKVNGSVISLVHLREDIALKAAVGFLEQFPRHLEVHRRFIHAAVPEVCGQ
jgi:hypothetical protein